MMWKEYPRLWTYSVESDHVANTSTHTKVSSPCGLCNLPTEYLPGSHSRSLQDQDRPPFKRGRSNTKKKKKKRHVNILSPNQSSSLVALFLFRVPQSPILPPVPHIWVFFFRRCGCRFFGRLLGREAADLRREKGSNTRCTPTVGIWIEG